MILEARKKLQDGSTTPTGTPPPPPALSNPINGMLQIRCPDIVETPAAAANPPDAASILSALAAMAKAAPPPPPPVTQLPATNSGPFGNPSLGSDPRVRKVRSPPQSIAIPTLPTPAPQ